MLQKELRRALERAGATRAPGPRPRARTAAGATRASPQQGRRTTPTHASCRSNSSRWKRGAGRSKRSAARSCSRSSRPPALRSRSRRPRPESRRDERESAKGWQPARKGPPRPIPRSDSGVLGPDTPTPVHALLSSPHEQAARPARADRVPSSRGLPFARRGRSPAVGSRFARAPLCRASRRHWPPFGGSPFCFRGFPGSRGRPSANAGRASRGAPVGPHGKRNESRSRKSALPTKGQES